MPEIPLNDEIRIAAVRVAAIQDDDVADFGSCIARMYRREREVVLALIGIDAMVSGEERDHDEEEPRLVAVRRRMRDRLHGLLAWARLTGRT